MKISTRVRNKAADTQTRKEGRRVCMWNYESVKVRLELSGLYADTFVIREFIARGFTERRETAD